MRKLSDYKDDDALELWADLLDPLTKILSDDKIRSIVNSGKPKLIIAKEILKGHKSEAVEILTRIDPEPVDGLNVVLRLINLITEIGQNDEIKSFFAYAEQAETDKESSGLPTENIEENEN